MMALHCSEEGVNKMRRKGMDRTRCVERKHFNKDFFGTFICVSGSCDYIYAQSWDQLYKILPFSLA